MKTMYAVLISRKGKRPHKIRFNDEVTAKNIVEWHRTQGTPAKYLGPVGVQEDGTEVKRNGKLR
jgi:hypothetical protein